MSDPISDIEKRLQFLRDNKDTILQATPWSNELGFKITRIERGHIWGVQPFDESLVGDPEAGVIHGGVITTMLDNFSGMACGAAMETFRFVATLDLRIDYMRPADSGRDIMAEAECYHVTRSVAFTRAWAYHDNRDRVIATAQGAFAINKPRSFTKG